MKELFELLKKASPAMLALVVVGYLLKVSTETFIEKKLEGRETRATDVAKAELDIQNEIARTSLDIKKDMRSGEREELVEFRVAVEKWEDFLQGCLTDLTMQTPTETQVADLFKKDSDLFLEVKVRMVKACVYLQDEKLEIHLRGTVINIRKLYYPIILNSLPKLIDAQSQLAPIQFKLKKFQESGGKDMAFAPTQKDLEDSMRLQREMTAQIKEFAEALLAQYKPIAEQLDDLKTSINKYLYRPIQHTEINKN